MLHRQTVFARSALNPEIAGSVAEYGLFFTVEISIFYRNFILYPFICISARNSIFFCRALSVHISDEKHSAAAVKKINLNYQLIVFRRDKIRRTEIYVTVRNAFSLGSFRAVMLNCGNAAFSSYACSEH